MMYKRRRRLGTETETKLVLYRVNVITLIMKYLTFGLINIRLNKVTPSVKQMHKQTVMHLHNSVSPPTPL